MTEVTISLTDEEAEHIRGRKPTAAPSIGEAVENDVFARIARKLPLPYKVGKVYRVQTIYGCVYYGQWSGENFVIAWDENGLPEDWVDTDWLKSAELTQQ